MDMNMLNWSLLFGPCHWRFTPQNDWRFTPVTCSPSALPLAPEMNVSELPAFLLSPSSVPFVCLRSLPHMLLDLVPVLR
jgi:hypothetical protein